MTTGVMATSLAMHPGPRANRVRIHGLLPTHRGDELIGRELMFVLPTRTDEVCKLAPWDGGEEGLRFRVHAGGRLDLWAPTDHPVVEHLRNRLGEQFWGLTRFETRSSWDTLELRQPVEVAPYKPKAAHDRPSVAKRVHLELSPEQAAWLSWRLSRDVDEDGRGMHTLVEAAVQEAGL